MFSYIDVIKQLRSYELQPDEVSGLFAVHV